VLEVSTKSVFVCYTFENVKFNGVLSLLGQFKFEGL
jgi:hypothetical protein